MSHDDRAMNDRPADDERPAIAPEMLVAGMVHLLDVQPVGDGLYRGARKPGGRGRVFGGQVIAQALMAATKSVTDGKNCHSLHAYFMRPGDEDYPIDYRVEADFDGVSFANRRVVAIQKDKPILNLAASFQRTEEGLEHQFAMPDVPPPEELINQADYARAHADGVPPVLYRLMTRPAPLELRPVGIPPFFRREKMEPRSHVWFRTVAPVHAGPEMHRAILALATDFSLLATSMLPHGMSWATHNIQTASLDHALWLHEDARVDDWLLYTTDSPWTGHARGFSRGSIYTRDGRLVASVAQEGLIRLRDGPPPHLRG